MQRELVQAPLGPAPAVRELALLGMRMEQLQAEQEQLQAYITQGG